MRYEHLPNGDMVPVLGLGTWNMGGGVSPDYSKDDEIIKTIQAAIEIGYSHIDTAEGYGNGHTEELVGEAMKGFSRRDLFITTKVSPSHLEYHDVWKAIKGSLRRLGTEYVDLYLIHWPNRSIPLENTFRALNELVEEGLVRSLGVSNFDLKSLQKSQELANSPIVTNQVPYNIKDRSYVKNKVLEYCQVSGCILTAYSPLKDGVLAEEIVRRIAKQYGATPAQVAISWLIRQPKVITIPKTVNLKRLQENLDALNLQLSEEDTERLDYLRGM
ncbi:MAG: aldo/keto reductase [Anaerolineales bacterium]|nr:aldo/keto reductase [Anaerolineales bacterium]